MIRTNRSDREQAWGGVPFRAALLALLTLAVGWPAAATAAGPTSFAGGALIVPMDTDYQDEGMLTAFGLVYELLRVQVPVHVAVTPGKSEGGVDFLADAIDHKTGAPVGTHAYRGGPFVVAAEDAARALPVVNGWLAGHPVAVHVATGPFAADVARTLVAAPNIALFIDGEEAVARKALAAAGIVDSVGDPTWSLASPDLISPAELVGPTDTSHTDGALFDGDGHPVYCQVLSAGWTLSDAQADRETVAEVRGFLGWPARLHAQNDALMAFENLRPEGGFLSVNGFRLDNFPTKRAVAQLRPDAPLAQLDGDFQLVSGSVRGFSACQDPPPASCTAGGPYRAGADTVLLNRDGQPPGSQDVYVGGWLDGLCPPDAPTCVPGGQAVSVGRIAYLSGRDYKASLPMSANEDTRGTRLLLQGLFDAPCAWKGFQPEVQLALGVPATTASATVTWTVDLTNKGQWTALGAIVEVALPPGATFTSASAGGTESGGVVSWPLDNLGPGEPASVSVTLELPSHGIWDLVADVSWQVGVTAFSTTSAPASTEYGPDADGDGVIDAVDTCPDDPNPAQDLDSDVQSCGACGVVCAPPHATPTCSAGVCGMGPCDAGWADCNGDPADGCEYDEAGFDTDLAHCGACNAACSAPSGTLACVGGACGITACPAGLEDCNGDVADGCEKDASGFDSNPLNCGTCGNACSTPHATPGCAGGLCAVGACDAGWLDCDGAAPNGCEYPELNLASDPDHCGACDTACAPPNAVPACDAGSCAIAACDAGWADCNGDPADGCEYDVTGFDSDVAHCGGCGMACAPANGSGACAAGTCLLAACDSGWADCNGDVADGCEVDELTFGSDPANCGGCGVVCDHPVLKMGCDVGACEPAPCDATWVPEACGTGVCASSEVCVSGFILKCVEGPPSMTDEVLNCDGLDNDCDGETDEGYDDGVACTASTCVGGVASDVPDHASCADTNPCTDDWCHGFFGCVSFPDNTNTPDPAEVDENPCTDLVCTFGMSLNLPDDTNVPDDGLPCTADTCDNGAEQHDLDPGWCFIGGTCYGPGEVEVGEPCGVCNPDVSQDTFQEVLFEDGFDDGDVSDWRIVDLSGSGVTWQPDAKRAWTPPWALYLGDPSSHDYDAGWSRVHAYAESPPVALPAGTVTLLEFRVWLETERYTSSVRYDVLWVEVVEEDGDVVPIWDSTRELHGTTNGYFYPASLDVGDWAGQTIRLRFRFDSWDGSDNDFEGAYIDDVRLRTACCDASADCDDSDGCTVDFCNANTCKYVETCLCTPNKSQLLIVLDFSGSMKSAAEVGDTKTKWEAAVQAISTALGIYGTLLTPALKLFRSPGSGSWCGVFNLAMEQPFGSKPDDIVSYLQGLTPAGSTPMGAGLRGARDIYRNLPDSGEDRFVLLLTDGKETCGGDPVGMIGDLQADGVGTYVLGFGSGVDEAVLNAAALAGGHARPQDHPGAVAFWSASNTKGVDRAVSGIFAELASERCNGIDDDCDGITDEDIVPVGCTVVCNGKDLPGARYCVDGDYGTCVVNADTELCNGIDDNCNGTVDEPWRDAEGPVLGEACSVGAGACLAWGTWACPPSGTGEAVCAAVPLPPKPETCDNVDNDCDGMTDEDLTQACTAGCNSGTERCFAGKWVLCTAVADPDNQCDGIDNDCDGSTDPLYPLVGEACDSKDSDFCAYGTWTCAGSQTAVECINESPTDVLEVCGGGDEDCDGFRDEENAVGCELYWRDMDGDGFGGGSPRCLCAPRWGYVVMVGGDCDDFQRTVHPGHPEVCDGMDNNCNGFTDEDPANVKARLWRVCYTGPPGTLDVGVCVSGISTCTAAAWGSCLGEVTPTPESCNGIDQDCDGTGDFDEPQIIETRDDHPCVDVDYCEYADCFCMQNGKTGEWGCMLE